MRKHARHPREEFVTGPSRAEQPASTQRCPLTPALLELLQAFLEEPDANAKVLGKRLCRSPETVRTELKTIGKILGVRSKFGAAVRALQHGWITLPPLPAADSDAGEGT